MGIRYFCDACKVEIKTSSEVGLYDRQPDRETMLCVDCLKIVRSVQKGEYPATGEKINFLWDGSPLVGLYDAWEKDILRKDNDLPEPDIIIEKNRLQIEEDTP